ncbi:hypothetical protein J1614_002986 [Plenodomus biglobosus]|nr:hypothetical protein J1614_002986 [Plenodomus biglobosus]
MLRCKAEHSRMSRRELGELGDSLGPNRPLGAEELAFAVVERAVAEFTLMALLCLLRLLKLGFPLIRWHRVSNVVSTR